MTPLTQKGYDQAVEDIALEIVEELRRDDTLDRDRMIHEAVTWNELCTDTVYAFDTLRFSHNRTAVDEGHGIGAAESWGIMAIAGYAAFCALLVDVTVAVDRLMDKTNDKTQQKI